MDTTIYLPFKTWEGCGRDRMMLEFKSTRMHAMSDYNIHASPLNS